MPSEDSDDDDEIDEDALGLFRLPIPPDVLRFAELGSRPSSVDANSFSNGLSDALKEGNEKIDASHEEIEQLEVLYVNKGVSELAFLHDEIIVRNVYLKHFPDLFRGLSSESTLNVVDIGANVGLFLLFLDRLWCSSCRGRPGPLRALAVEPSPRTVEALTRNLGFLGKHVDCKVLQTAVGKERRDNMAFRYYERMPGNSTLDFTTKENSAHRDTLSDSSIYNEHVDIIVSVRTLDQLLEEAGWSEDSVIDLLKIDCEGSELAVLQGISDSLWTRIRRIVIEVEGFRDGKECKEVLELLQGKRFSVSVEESRVGPSACYVYAVSK